MRFALVFFALCFWITACSPFGAAASSTSPIEPIGSSDGSVLLDASTPTQDSSVEAQLDTCCAKDGIGGCCKQSLPVPGGTFKRGYDGVNYLSANAPAILSDFDLDRYSVTIGRFRKFVDDYPNSLPIAGMGKNVHAANDLGWDISWNALMPATKADLLAGLQCADGFWTDVPGDHEDNPITCVTWYEAFALCASEGLRLVTDAEWNYAASGGEEQRVFAWSSPPSNMDRTSENAAGLSELDRFAPVGSRPKGDGRWGHSDLTDGTHEWVRDTYEGYTLSCVDCIASGNQDNRVFRGNFASQRISRAATDRHATVGMRCAK